MNDPDRHVSRCELCSLSDTRKVARAEQAELLASLDSPVGRDSLPPTVTSWQRLFQSMFVLHGLLALMEVSKFPVAAVSSAQLGIQTGRHRQQMVDDLAPFIRHGVIKVLNPGNDHGDRHGDAGRGYEAAVYGVGELMNLTAAQARARERFDQRMSGLFVERARAADYAADWTAYQSDQGSEFAAAAVRDSDLVWAAAASPTEAMLDLVDLCPWLSQIEDQGNLGCHDPGEGSECLVLMEGRVVPIMYRDIPPKDHDNSSCPPAAPSPVCYMGWSDAFQDNRVFPEAGVLGWIVACAQVRYWPDRSVDEADGLGLVTGTDLAKRFGGTRQTWTKALNRFVDRGYAEKAEAGKYRLLFLDMYRAGELHRHERSSQLFGHYAAQQDERDERRLAIDTRPSTKPPEPWTGSIFAVWSISESLAAKNKAAVEHLIRPEGQPNLRNFENE